MCNYEPGETIFVKAYTGHWIERIFLTMFEGYAICLKQDDITLSGKNQSIHAWAFHKKIAYIPKKGQVAMFSNDGKIWVSRKLDAYDGDHAFPYYTNFGAMKYARSLTSEEKGE